MMHISVDELFNILNLAARVGLVVYLMRRYGVGKIQLAIVHEKTDLEMMQQQHTKLRESSAQVAEQIKQDEQSFVQLQSKFETWNQQVAKTEQQQQFEHQQRQQRIESLLEKKMEYLQRRQLIEVEVAQLLQQAEKRLQQQFANSADLGKKYRTKLMEKMV